jgi:hypothetical protein
MAENQKTQEHWDTLPLKSGMQILTHCAVQNIPESTANTGAICYWELTTVLYPHSYS